jgi:hypothetical protein
MLNLRFEIRETIGQDQDTPNLVEGFRRDSRQKHWCSFLTGHGSTMEQDVQAKKEAKRVEDAEDWLALEGNNEALRLDPKSLVAVFQLNRTDAPA